MSFLDAACANFSEVAGQRREGVTGVLCLADGEGAGAFDRLRRHVHGGGGEPFDLDGWTVEGTHEDVSLVLDSNAGARLIVLGGSQIRTAEGLEVLALGTRASFDHGESVAATMESVARGGGLPVLPWGFGKWTGRRRRLVRRLLRREDLPTFFLGDNANRPDFLPRSGLFETAEEHGIADLPGSDPLPFPSEVGAAGRAGFALAEPLARGTPARDLKQRLLGGQRPVRTFLRPESPVRFLRNQLSLRLRRRP